MIRNAFFVMLMASFLFAQSVYAKCLYKGKEHILFDSIAVIDDKCANEMKAQKCAKLHTMSTCNYVQKK